MQDMDNFDIRYQGKEFDETNKINYDENDFSLSVPKNVEKQFK